VECLWHDLLEMGKERVMSFFKIGCLVLKSLFQKPATRRYPFEVRPDIKGARGQIANDTPKCTYCTICQIKCPTRAITVNKAGKSWEIDPLKCITCNYCVEVCPQKSLSMETPYSAACTK